VRRVFAKKQAMLEHHASQRDWLRKHHGIDDYILQMEASTRRIGERFGVQYANIEATPIRKALCCKSC